MTEKKVGEVFQDEEGRTFLKRNSPNSNIDDAIRSIRSKLFEATNIATHFKELKSIEDEIDSLR